ncbi:MAG TPA: peptidoglycan bridge formation glycyltransferase FemA/FemB family protein [Candidatus Saccharimonadia bacterium]|nr:peptidoglycan bridge formation glycyltransferase FemA/FemB family protein [Candidatus Saccharimonadia bacterium]
MKKALSVRECSAKEYGKFLPQVAPTGKTISFLQAPFYGAWQTRDGKTVVYFVAEADGKPIAAGLAVKYDAPGGISFFYCPYGPTARHWTPELFTTLHAFLKPIAIRAGATFVRFDVDGLSDLATAHPITNYQARTASLQPRAEWLLDISGDQESLWMGMHKHARYNVRLAERAKARIELYEPAKAPLDTFFALMEATAGRDEFSIQSRSYYEAVLQSIPASNGFVTICTIDGKPAAASIFAEYDGVLHYVFSGSSNDFRKIAPPYFVIWNAILEARKRNLHTLNFGGITDPVKSTHLQGVTAFKKRFGGYEVTHNNPVDLIYRPFKYALFSLYKRLR